MLGKRHVIMFLIFVTLCTFGVALTNFALTSWVEEAKGFAIDEIGAVMAVMSVGCFLVSLPMGYIFDMLPSKRTTCIIAAAMTAIANLSLVWCRTRAEVFLGLFWFGGAHGAIYVVQCSMARVLADMRIAAAFFGLVRGVGCVGAGGREVGRCG